jgi:hypothetical protein
MEAEEACARTVFLHNEVLISFICVCLNFEQKEPEYLFNNNFVSQVKKKKDSRHVKSNFVVQYVMHDKKNCFTKRSLCSQIMA